MDEKLELVGAHRDEYGLSACLNALGVSKGTWHYRMRKGSKWAERKATDAALRPVVVKIIGENPAYGYRRIQPDLEEAIDEVVNHKRLRRLLNEWDLALLRAVSRPKRSGIVRVLKEAKGHLNLAAGLDPDPLELLSTDFTEIPYAAGRKKAHLMAMLDVDSCWVPGWAVGPSADRALALRCWNVVGRAYSDLGRDLAGVIVHQDQDPVFTSHAWLQALILDAGARVSYSERGAKDNPWIESFWSRFKGENASLFTEARDLKDLAELIDTQMRYYNRRRRHSRLGNQPPQAYLKSEGIGPRLLSTN